MKSLLLILAALYMSACASKAKQTESYLAANQQTKASKVIEPVAFIKQEQGECGPATLAMALNYQGVAVTKDEVAAQIYNPKMKGSLQNDLISATRKKGMMAVVITGLPALIKEVDDGHPVIVFENAGLSWLPQWHYALVLGYDLAKEEIIMHSGLNAYAREDMKVFERSWMLADYWGLVVLPPGEIAKSAGVLANLVAAAGLEQAGLIDAAEKSYQRILQEWPGSLGALIGLGNTSYKKKNFKEAHFYLKQATELHPKSLIAAKNFAVVDFMETKNKKTVKR